MPTITLAITAATLAAACGLAFAVWVFRRCYVTVDPDEYVVHYRNGRVINIGRGRSFLALPYDTYLKVPGTLRDINFCADQITMEKQGVRVQGFLAYRIEDFDKAYRSLDFKSHSVRLLPSCEENVKNQAYPDKTACKVINLDPRDVLAKTDVILRQLAESVVRHEVSNKSLQQMITEREKVRESMKQQLMDTVDDWGISIDTIEFTEVWIRSKEVFENLQAQYRNDLKFSAETSTFDTNKAIAEKRLETERLVGQMEAETEQARRVATSTAQLEASKVEIENQRQGKEQVLEADSAVREREREKQHAAAVREAELALARKLLEQQNRLAAQEREHQVLMDMRERAEAIRVREAETLRRLAELEAQAAIEAAELARQKIEVELKTRAEEEEAKVRLRIAAEQAEAEARRIASADEAERVVQIADAERRAAQESAQGVRATGTAEAEVTALKVGAENQVNVRQIQKMLVGEISQMAAKMKVNDVNWINIAGSSDDSPLGIIPRNVLQLLTVFKGLGIGLDDVLHGGSGGAAGGNGHAPAPVPDDGPAGGPPAPGDRSSGR
jgi:regulator of protease activity HflC (stomatin/prohibitin superfamily)